MDSSDYLEKLKAASERAKPRGRSGISAADAVAETKVDDGLFADYASGDYARTGIAAFRIEALLRSPRFSEFDTNAFRRIHEALRSRITDVSARVLGSDIANAYHSELPAETKKDLIAGLYARLKGHDEHSLISYSGYLVPIIGIDYLYEYQTSTLMGVSGGMGAPMHYCLRDFALERICAHLGLKPKHIVCFDGKAKYYSWSVVPRLKL
jgi:hypothetical protein